MLTGTKQAGIGTDATMHDHIKKLLDRCYATKDANTRFCPTTLGEGLVMGYDTMGHELWKPDLRALMESDMKAVSDGRKTKPQVLGTALEGMKSLFISARTQKEMLLDAMGIFFERSVGGGEQRQAGERVRLCPLCQQNSMILRKKPDGKFMVGCSGYPTCRNVVWLPGPAMEANVTNQPCPSCGPGQVLKIYLKFRRAEIPPNFDVEHTGCVGCDRVIKDLIEICGTGPRPTPGGAGPPTGQPNRPGIPRGFPNTNSSGYAATGNTNVPGNSNGFGNSGHFVSGRDANQRNCTNCGQSGHYNMDCPRYQQGRTPNRVQDRRRNDSSVPTASASAATGTVRCECDKPCKLLTANTEANRGRRFHRCPTGECEFFQWEDAPGVHAPEPEPIPTQRGQARGQGRGRGGRRGRATSRATARSTSSRTVISSSSGSSRSSGARGGQSNSTRGTFVSATGESGSVCFRCNQSGHWANACPTRNM